MRHRTLRGVVALVGLVGCGGRAVDVAGDGGDDGATIIDSSVTTDALRDTSADTPSFVQDAGAEAPTGCNPQTCPLGCCDGDTCVTKISPDQCGSSGEACVKCQPNENCKGVCFHPQANCGPSNCQGCCLGNNDCAAGNAAAACGNGGQQCTSCVPSKGTGQCIPAEAGVGGTCTDQQCGPDTCPSGCCQNGICLSGESEAACGELGVACQTCGPGTFCTAGACKPGTACTPQNCPSGCCGVGTDGGICFAGTDDTICGTGGLSCTDCQNANQVCVAGVCGIPCSPSTCHGCCDGNICAEGDQNFLCGTAGLVCHNCEPQGQTCKAGACQ